MLTDISCSLLSITFVCVRHSLALVLLSSRFRSLLKEAPTTQTAAWFCGPPTEELWMCATAEVGLVVGVGVELEAAAAVVVGPLVMLGPSSSCGRVVAVGQEEAVVEEVVEAVVATLLQQSFASGTSPESMPS
jgi:hypothetical protein